MPLQGRGIGEFALVDAVPEVVVLAFALVTQLGDTWFYFLALSLLYLLGRHAGLLTRRHAAFAVALAVGAGAVTAGLKHLFAFGRPPGAGTVDGPTALPAVARAVYEVAATADGFGFPSGHATGSTVVYGGLALLLDIGSRWQRALAAGTVVVLVGLSRVILGVHYAVDVLAGFLVGGCYLATVYWAGDRGESPSKAFLAAVLVGIAALLVGRFAFDPAATLGAAVGGLLGWHALGGTATRLRESRRAVLLALAGLGALGAAFGAIYAAEPAAPVAVAGTALVVAGIVALPVGAVRARETLGWG